MSEFKGGSKVRCVDCIFLTGNICSGKKNSPKVAPKKRRGCVQYNFKGVFQNRESLPSTHDPYMSRKTKQTLKKLIKNSQMPVKIPGSRTFVIPASTATLPDPVEES